MPDTVLSPLFVLAQLTPTMTLRGRCYCYPHFTDEQTELRVVKQLVQGLMIDKLQRWRFDSGGMREDLTLP